MFLNFQNLQGLLGILMLLISNSIEYIQRTYSVRYASFGTCLNYRGLFYKIQIWTKLVHVFSMYSTKW